MNDNVRLPTVWLSPQLLAAATAAATQDNRKMGAYLRSLIVKDCRRRNIPIDQPTTPEAGPRLDSVGLLRRIQQEIDGPGEH